MDPARIFEPEAEERARVSAAMRKRFLRLKAPLRSPVPPPFLSPRRIFLSFGGNKNPYPTKISAQTATNISRLSHMNTQALRSGLSTVHGARKSVARVATGGVFPSTGPLRFRPEENAEPDR